MEATEITTENLARIYKVDPEVVRGWIDCGLPTNEGPSGVTHDHAASVYWIAGHRHSKTAALKNIEQSPSKKIAFGWLLGESPEGAPRLEDLRQYVAMTKRAGITTRESLASLHYAMGMAHALDYLPVPDQAADR